MIHKKVKITAKYSRSGQEQQRNAPPAATPEGRENQLISLAFDLAEKRLRAGTASAQEVTLLLKLGAPSTRTERAILERQEELLAAKTEAIHAAKRADELFVEAIKAMKSYVGGENDDSDGRDDGY